LRTTGGAATFDEKSSKKGKKSKGRQRFKKAIKTKKKRR